MKSPPRVDTGKRPNPCASALYAQVVDRRIDLPAIGWMGWMGWKVRGDWLIGPGGIRFNPRTLAAAWRHYIKQECRNGGD